MEREDGTEAEADVRDNQAESRYEITIDGRTSFLRYERRPQAIVLAHTEVPPALRGRGLAGELVKTALDAAAVAGLRVIPRCPYVQSYLQKHPEYQSLVE